MLKLGLDIGSTTIKCVVLDEENKIIYSTYERHYSQITEKIAEILTTVRSKVKGVENAAVALSGSAGMGVAESSTLTLCRKFTQQELLQIHLFRAQMLSLNSAVRTQKFCSSQTVLKCV